MRYALFWKGKCLKQLGTFKTKAAASTAKGIEETQMELAEYSPAQLRRNFKIKKAVYCKKK